MRMKLTMGLMGALIAAMLTASPAAAADQTVKVSGNTSAGENQPGWLFNRDASTSTPYEFNADAASTGFGSLYVLPIGANASDKFIGEFFPDDADQAIADVESFSYDFQIGSGGAATDANEFYLNVYANFGVSDDDKFYDCRYNVVPTTGSTSGFTTVTFDPTQAYPVTTRGGGSASPFTCPAVPADMDGLSPGSNIRVFALNVGDTSTNDVGLDGYLDNVVFDANGTSTAYDFEPTPATKDDCKKGGYATYGFKNQGECVSSFAPGKN
jgi:hypothetical protein